MTVNRLYATGKVLDVNDLTAKIGNEKVFYKTKHVHKTIKDHPEGIAHTPLVFMEMKDIFNEVTLPLISVVNKNSKSINNSIYDLRSCGYIKSADCEPNANELKYYTTSHFLHKELMKEGSLDKLVKIDDEEYKVRSLSFEEMMKGGEFQFFIIGECMLEPKTLNSIAEKLGYKEETLHKSMSALKYCNLLNREFSQGKIRYSLANDLEKVGKFFEKSKEKKEKKISRMKKYIEAVDVIDNPKLSMRDIAMKLELPYGTVDAWLNSDQKPKIKDKIAKILQSQNFITKEDFEIFDICGLIEKTNSSY